MTQKLVIFDMGNTLLDFHAGIHTDDEKDVIGTVYMSEFLLNKYNVSIEPNIIKRELIDKWYADFYKRKQLIELDVNQYISDFKIKMKIEALEIDGLDLMSQFYRPYMEEVVVNPGAVEVLTKLHDKANIGVISNCILYDSIYMKVFEEQGLSPFVDKFIFSYSRQIRKPDKRLFKEMLAYFDVAAEETVMVGDSLNADITPAKEMGMTTVLYNKLSKERKDKNDTVDYIVSNLNEVATLLDSRKKECNFY